LNRIFVLAHQTPLILSIETATRAGSLCLSRGEALLAVRAGESPVSHSEHLLQAIRSVLDDAGLTLGEVDVFAASSGPGSFTGLRIGLATVKSFAATLKRSCLGIPTLYAIANSAGQSKRTLALLPAGRGEMFAQLLAVDKDGDVHPLESPIHIAPDKLLEKVQSVQSLVWAGEGALTMTSAIQKQAHALGVSFGDETQRDPAEVADASGWILARSQGSLAEAVGRLALLRVRTGEIVSPEQLRAIYVRPSDAEINK
jgi:tRNA threonylcarbamoyladenosine biosynthesis protein TsaB